MAVYTLPTAGDMTETMVAEAAAVVGRFPKEATVYCSFASAPSAQKVHEAWGCTVILLPNDIFKDEFAWCARFGDDFVWSPGA